MKIFSIFDLNHRVKQMEIVVQYNILYFFPIMITAVWQIQN